MPIGVENKNHKYKNSLLRTGAEDAATGAAVGRELEAAVATGAGAATLGGSCVASCMAFGFHLLMPHTETQ